MAQWTRVLRQDRGACFKSQNLAKLYLCTERKVNFHAELQAHVHGRDRGWGANEKRKGCPSPSRSVPRETVYPVAIR